MNDAHVHGDTGHEIDTAAINEGIRYTMFSVFSVTETLPADEAERKAVVADAEAAVGGGSDPAATTGDLVTRGWYDIGGLRSDADLLLWTHGASIEAVQGAYQRLRASELGRSLEPVWSVAALHRPAEFNRGHVPAFLAGEAPRDYICVYPFVRSYDWYLLPEAERRTMLRDHGMAAAGYKDVRANTVSAFALGDYEWILAFEADALHRIVDLMRDRGCRDLLRGLDRLDQRGFAAREGGGQGCGAQVVVGEGRGGQAGGLQVFDGGAHLTLARLDQQVPPRAQEPRGQVDHAAEDHQAVVPAVERGVRLVLAGLRRHHADRRGRYVRRVRDEDVDVAPHLGGERFGEVARVGVRGERAGSGGGSVVGQRLEVLVRAGHGGRVDVGGVDLDIAPRREEAGRDGAAERATAAAQVDQQHRAGTGVGCACGRLPDQQLGPLPRHEHAGRHQPAPTVELGPAHQVLQREPADARGGELLEAGGVAVGGLGDDPGLVLGEDTAGGAQARYEFVHGVSVGEGAAK
jgi:peroxiredoxin